MNTKVEPHSMLQKGDAKIPDLVKICYFEMDDAQVQRLLTMFTIIFKGRFCFVSSDEAMIALIDIKDPIGEENLLLSYQKKYSSLPIIALVNSVADRSNDNIYYIEKPLRREIFWAAVVDLFSQKNNLKAVSKNNTFAKMKNISFLRILHI